ncbi:hypothetical protein PDESU_06394 [Pontiella desulfatans]|uniref:Xylose isomerase-like TIM barrel domain-containing protein n=1 Tax=Pontiella desulfatans TaxID=2750659 RepID=A0A6C2UC74_PONDE|nr:TIM barrel protein [Pontiella desulfatans]VGO17792.1 hypothetical protein PDESU_06394 [Pontiella desulfatans]
MNIYMPSMFGRLLAVLLCCVAVRAERPFFPFDNGLTDVKSVEEQAKLLKELGYDGICTRPPNCTPELLEAFDRHGVKIMASYVTLAPDPDKFPGNLEQHFMQLQGRGTLVWLGISNAKANETPAVETIRKTCDLAKKYGLEVVLYPHINFRTDTVERTAHLMKLAGRDNLGISFNVCHFLAQSPDGKLEETIQSIAPNLKLVQVSGANMIPEPKSDWNQLILPLGEGDFDMKRVFKTLDEVGYAGPVNLQCYRVPLPAKEQLNKSMNAWRKYHEQP